MVSLPLARSAPGVARTGFTLIEMLVVMAIIVVIASFVSPFVSGVVTSMHLTQSGELAVNVLTLARRTAISRSHIVEVRFFQCADPADPTSTVQWRALQAVERLENGTEQLLGRAAVIPNRIIMSGTAAASPLLGAQTSYTSGPNDTLPTYLGTIKGSCRFRFLPDGSTDLVLLDVATLATGSSTVPKWFVTLYNENDKSKGDPPPNYVTLQIEPATGALTVLKP